MDIKTAKTQLGDPLEVLGAKVSAVVGYEVGVSFDGEHLWAHVPDAKKADVNAVQAVIDGVGTLAIATNKRRVTANGVDVATITASGIKADTAVYRVWRGTAEYTAETEAAVTDGNLTLEFAPLDKGTFTVVVEADGLTGFVVIGAS